MPIPQSRLITLVAIADHLTTALDNTKQLTKESIIRDTLADANSALGYIDDANTRSIIKQLMQVITQLVNHISEIDIPQSLRDTVTEERVHFKKNRKANENLAVYYRLRRQANKEQEISVTNVFADLPPPAKQNWQDTAALQVSPSIAAEQNTSEAIDTRFKAIETERKLERSEELARKMVEDQKEIEELKTKERLIIPPGDEISIEELKRQQEKVTKLKVVDKDKGTKDEIEATMRKVTYDANVISASLPTPEELRDNLPIKPGENVL